MSPFRRPSECRLKWENLLPFRRWATTKLVKCKQSSGTVIQYCFQHRSKLAKTNRRARHNMDCHACVLHGPVARLTDCIVVIMYRCSKVDGGSKSGSFGICSLHTLMARARTYAFVLCVCVCVCVRAHVCYYVF